MGSPKVISAKEAAALVSENNRLMVAVFLTFHSRCSQDDDVDCYGVASGLAFY